MKSRVLVRLCRLMPRAHVREAPQLQVLHPALCPPPDGAVMRCAQGVAPRTMRRQLKRKRSSVPAAAGSGAATARAELPRDRLCQPSGGSGPPLSGAPMAFQRRHALAPA